MIMNKQELEAGLYLINGKRQLYWQNGEWFKPTLINGRYTGNISPMEKQPKIIKSIEKINTRW